MATVLEKKKHYIRFFNINRSTANHAFNINMWYKQSKKINEGKKGALVKIQDGRQQL